MASPVLPQDMATTSLTTPALAEPETPFPYGWRDVIETLPNGETVWKQIPLTLEDVLYPKEGDTIPITSDHDDDVHLFKDWVRHQLRNDPTSLVLSDTLVRWGVPDIKDPSPDVSVFLQVQDRDRNFSLFELAQEKAETLLVFEYVSPSTRVNDVDKKLVIYHKARVPIYVIVDQEREDGPRRLIGWRWTPTDYAPMPLDQKGMLLLPSVNLTIGLRNNRLVGFDAETGEEMRDYESSEQSRRQEAEARRQAEEERDHEAEARRQEAEARRQAELAQKLAEATRDQEAEARRQEAEARRHAELARKLAEEERDQEAEARRQAEEKLKELTERLRRLEQVLPPGEAHTDS